VTDIQKIIFHLKERGIGVLITDHNVRETLKITDRAYIVHDGVIFRSGTPDGDWASMGIPSDGSYGVEEGIISGYPCTCSGGGYRIVEGLEVPDFSRERIDATVAELKEERDAVEELGLI
jgi:malate/lactate dehydrogenase